MEAWGHNSLKNMSEGPPYVLASALKNAFFSLPMFEHELSTKICINLKTTAQLEFSFPCPLRNYKR